MMMRCFLVIAGTLGLVETLAKNLHIRRDGKCHSGLLKIQLLLCESSNDQTIDMTRLPPFSSPLLVGFDAIEKKLEQIAKSGDSYPPYNIERISVSGAECLRVTLAVAGFAENDLEVLIEENQLVVRGRQRDEETARDYLHRGIAARQFQRVFMLADGMQVKDAHLSNGLLSIDLQRPEPERIIRRIKITTSD
jgi:HSP20 family molecular chaperone IbpA